MIFLISPLRVMLAFCIASFLLADFGSASDRTSLVHPNTDSCSDGHYGLFASGPCQSNLIFCHKGNASFLNCPQSLVFNPTSKFCEKPEDFISLTPNIPQHTFIVTQIPEDEVAIPIVTNPSVFHPIPSPPRPLPFVGYMEPEGGASYSVFQPSMLSSGNNQYAHQIQDHPMESVYRPLYDDEFTVAQIPEDEEEETPIEASPSVFYPLPPPHSPFVGHMEPEDDTLEEDASYANPSVFHSLPPPPPFVGQMEPEEEDTSYANPSVFYPLPPPHPPFVGHVEPEDDASYSVLQPPMVPSDQYAHQIQDHPTENVQHPHPPVVEVIDDAFMSDGDQSEAAKEQQKVLVDIFKTTGYDTYAPKVSTFAPLDSPNDAGHDWFKTPTHMPSDSHQYAHQIQDHPTENVQHPHPPVVKVVDDAFMPDQSEAAKEQQKVLVDNFKTSGHDTFAPKVSAFAPLDIPTDAGHDSFKTPTHRRPVHSEFAPMNTPVELGHDVFKTRTKRSANAPVKPAVVEESMEMCRQLYADQLAKSAIQSENVTTTQRPKCVRNDIPNGCRQLYFACINGSRVRRHCPVGLFFDPRKEQCKEREQIAVCMLHLPRQLSPPKSSPTSPPQQRRGRPMPTSRSPPANKISPPANMTFPHTNMTSSPPSNMTSQANISSQNITSPPANITSQSSQRRPTPPRTRPAVTTQANLQPKIPDYAHYYPEKFCSELPDGFYRHPKNCSRIIQCFAHELYEYPSCQHDLAFNENTGVCDYPSNVPGCSPSNENQQTSNSSASENELVQRLTNDREEENGTMPISNNASSPTVATAPPTTPIGTCAGGHAHGDHIEHPQHCSAFLRCVWGQLVPMSCPRGTAFNPQLSVCDYPNNVPNCQSA